MGPMAYAYQLRSRRSVIFSVASSPASRSSASCRAFSCSGVMATRQRETRLPAKAKACDVRADAALRISTLHRRCLHDNGRFASFPSSDTVRSRTSRNRPLFSAPNSKLFAGNYGCNIWRMARPRAAVEPNARLCVAVAQVVKVKAGREIEVKRQKTSTSSVSVREPPSPLRRAMFLHLCPCTGSATASTQSNLGRHRTWSRNVERTAMLR